MLLLSPIPHGKEEDHARKEAALCDPEEKSRGEESGHALSDAQQGGHYAPRQGECRKPNLRRG